MAAEPAPLALLALSDAVRATLLAGDWTGAGALVPGPGWPDDGTPLALAAGIADRVVLLAGEAVGTCGVVRLSQGVAELGWGLTEPVRGRGLGTRTVRLLMADALARPGVRALSAEVGTGNLASLRAALRAGFYVDGVCDGHLLLRTDAG